MKEERHSEFSESIHNKIEEGKYRVDFYSSESENKRSGGRNGIDRSSAVGIGTVLLFLLTKGKAFLFTFFSLFVTIWTYSMFYGWSYAVGIVVMIAIHELGHLVFAKLVGMPVSLPWFIPFVGALITMKEPPKDAWQEAVVALGGPFFGLVAGIVTLYWGIVNHSGLLNAIAYFSFFITLFNMIPVSPLDGGRIVTALSPWVWVLGLGVMGLALWYTFSPIMVLIFAFGVYRAVQTWKMRDQAYYAAYFSISPLKRLVVGVAYGLITAVSGFGVYLFTN